MERDLAWKELKAEVAYRTRVFDLELVERTGKGDHRSTFVRLNAPDWVVVIPWFVDQDGTPCFWMEDQFRHGSGEITREFPAGMAEKGESAIESAKRELEEETGFRADLKLLAKVNPNSALFCNHQSIFLAENLERSGNIHFDENEDIVLVKVPVEEAIENMGSGIYSNGVMMSALGFFLREAEKRPELRRISR